jgi:hypothetical protein
MFGASEASLSPPGPQLPAPATVSTMFLFTSVLLGSVAPGAICVATARMCLNSNWLLKLSTFTKSCMLELLLCQTEVSSESLGCTKAKNP